MEQFRTKAAGKILFDVSFLTYRSPICMKIAGYGVAKSIRFRRYKAVEMDKLVKLTYRVCQSENWLSCTISLVSFYTTGCLCMPTFFDFAGKWNAWLHCPFDQISGFERWTTGVFHMFVQFLTHFVKLETNTDQAAATCTAIGFQMVTSSVLSR